VPKEGSEKEEEEEGTNALQLLLFLATDMEGDIKSIAAEVLALASSDKVVLSIIIIIIIITITTIITSNECNSEYY
jgi:bisphosphoglycerate-independent phosphoglycerate mutase (AlkP superfamily)